MWTIKDGHQGPEDRAEGLIAWVTASGGQWKRRSPRKGNYKGPLRCSWKASNSWLRTLLTFSHSNQHCLTLGAWTPALRRAPSLLRPQRIHSPRADLSSCLLWPHGPTSAISLPGTCAGNRSITGCCAGHLWALADKHPAFTAQHPLLPAGDELLPHTLRHWTPQGGGGSWQIWNKRRKPAHWVVSWQEERKDPAV